MSLGAAFSAGEASCSQSSVRPSRSYAAFVYCHPVVFTVARCHSFGAGESSCSQSSSCLAASSLSSSSRPSWHRRLSSSSCPAWHLHCRLPHARRGIVVVVFLRCRLPHARRGIVVVVFLTPVMASSLVVFLMPGVASPLSSSSRPSWHLRCRLPHARRGIVTCRLPHARRGISVDVFLTPVVASSLVVFLMPGVAYTAFFRSAHRGCQCAISPMLPLPNFRPRNLHAIPSTRHSRPCDPDPQ